MVLTWRNTFLCHLFLMSAMLKMSGVKIELITDVSAYLMVESAIRGGIASISNPYFRERIISMVPGYDETKPTSYIMYLDMVNLYSYSMSLPLPVGDYKFLDQEEIDIFDILSVDPQGDWLHYRLFHWVPRLTTWSSFWLSTCANTHNHHKRHAISC